ncbi:hypothetical protein HA466_0305300 [Hirschfeldia incana]|nr:hypothetical protein HA466_0305300 [Hirschfeldia incana]
MKPGGVFALNPHAASYVPIYKRVDDMDGLATHNVLGQQQMVMPKKYSEVAYKQIRDEDDSDLEMDIDMDIEYLLVTFSGLSQESITDVYLANSGDLEATIEMLNQLEVSSSVISRDHSPQEHLPETLDIGDLCESGPSNSKASTQKKAATEVAVSSSLIIPNTTVSA